MQFAIKQYMGYYKRLVIADDLTGANDTGIHFIAAEGSVGVITDSDGCLPENDVDTLVVNTNSRMLSEKEAYNKVLRAVEKYSAQGSKDNLEIYKKIDSTLRGNVGAEIDAMIDGAGFDIVCVAPASPRNGRQVLSGLCYVQGQLLENTEIAKDLFTPVVVSDVKEIISSQTDRKVERLNLDLIRHPLEMARTEVLRLSDEGVSIVVADSESIDDLKKIKAIFSNIDMKVLFVGAAGLYHAVSDESVSLMKKEFPLLRKNFKFLFVIGSLMETTIRQVDWLRNHCSAGSVTISTKNVLADSEDEILNVSAEVLSCFAKEDTIVLHTEKNGSDFSINSDKIGFVIGESVRHILESSNIDVVLFSGGDTSMHILQQLKVNYLSLIDEALPGIPVAKARVSGKDKDLLIITKSGSYGDEDAFEKIFEYLSEKILEDI